MPRIRIVAVSASVFTFLAIALGSAAAQTATNGATTAPLPLLQFLQHKSKAKLKPAPKPAVRLAKKTMAKRHVASRTAAKLREHDARGTRLPAGTATAALPHNIWPEANAQTPADAALGNLATGNSAPDDPAPGNAAAGAIEAPAAQSTSPSVRTAAVVETNPNEIVTDGQTVQLTSPEKLNPIDLADDDGREPTKTSEAAAPRDPAASEPTLHAMVTNPAADLPSPIGSASWIAHVVAALGGAITAGAVAWFLIGPVPRRTYG